MATKSATIDVEDESEAGYLAAIDEGLKEIAAIRANMKETDARIQRLEESTRRKLKEIRASLGHAQKAA